MPATAGRVRMPANNRVHSSAALQTHGIWQSAIGYDPYAPTANKEENKKSAQVPTSNADPDGENAYASFQGLLALARITGSNADEARGACKKCGRVGHLTFQCRNFLSIKEDKEKDPEAIQAAVMSGLEKIKGNGKRTVNDSSDESEEEDSESSDSDYDSEMERAIALKYGKKLTSKSKSSRKKKDDDSDDTSEDDEREKRGRSKKRTVKRRKEKTRRKDDESSDDELDRRSHRRKSRKEKRRRRSHRDRDDSDSSEDSIRRRKRKIKKRSDSDLDGSSSEDSRVGRDKKRSERRNRK